MRRAIDSIVRRLLPALALACAQACAWGAPPSVAGEQPLAIGFAGPLGSPVLQSARDGAQLAVNEHNAQAAAARGGKPQRRFALLEQDDRSEPRYAPYVAQYFVRSEVVGVVGHWSADVALAVAPIYEEHLIPQVMFTASAPLFTQQNLRTAFRLLGSSDRTARYLADAAVALEARRVAVLASDTAFGLGLAKAFTGQLESRHAGAQLVYQGSVSGKTSDFSAAFQALEDSRPDLVLFAANSLQVAAFVKAAQRTRLAGSLLLTAGAVNQQVGREEGSRLAVYTLEPEVNSRQCKAWAEFAARFQASFGYVPTSFSRYAYSAARVLIDAAQEAGGGGRRLLEALHGKTFMGLSGPLAFDERGNARNDFYTLYRNGSAGWTPWKEFTSGAAAGCR